MGLAVGRRPFVGGGPFEGAGVTVEAFVPLLRTSDHTRGTADPFPPRRRHRLPVVEDGCRRQQPHHVVAMELAVGECEQPEERASQHALGQGADRGSVVGKLRGVELFMDEACVGLGRPVQDGHALQGDAVAQGADDETHRGAHLVVGIRRGHDASSLDR